MHSKIFFLRAFIFLFLISGLTAFINIPFTSAAIRTLTGTVTRVSDGDTIHITTPEQTKLKVRMYGIDAPETPKVNNHTDQINKSGQPYGKESWKALESKIMGKKVKLDVIKIDRYRRMVGIIWLDNRNINMEMISEGYAEAYVEYLQAPYRSKFMEAQLEAKSAKKGIWSLLEYERPKDFRQRLKM
jgi:micrococcal nuclease